jgi:Transglutaminase-like superfamily
VGVRRFSGLIAGARIATNRSVAVTVVLLLSWMESGTTSANALGRMAGMSGQGTLVLSGVMSSRAGISLSGAFSVGHAHDLDWDLMVPTSLTQNGYREDVRSVSFAFSVPPDSSQNFLQPGGAVRRFHWHEPPANTVITVRERLDITVTSDLSPFHSRAAYPLDAPPPDVAVYLLITSALKLPTAVVPLLDRFAAAGKRETTVVNAVANWVAAHTSYQVEAERYATAAWALSHHRADCRGYTNLMAALLRRLGIPAQVEYGVVSGLPITLKLRGGRVRTVRWSATGKATAVHVWLNVYFPDAGWVPFDPQREKFFVDSRHFGFMAILDATDVSVGRWMSRVVDSLSPTGVPLANGAIEIVPGDGTGGEMAIKNRDDLRVRVRAIRKDQQSVTLLER